MGRSISTLRSRTLFSSDAFVYNFALVILFWTLFDATLQYVTPLLMQERGFSASLIGMIIGFSSLAGALFDLLLCRFFSRTDFKRFILAMFAICSVYPLFLWHADSIALFLFAMAVWGLYFDLYSFSTFSFVGRYTAQGRHSESFGLVQIFRSLGLILAPLIVGLVLSGKVGWQLFSLSRSFLLAGFLLFLVLLFAMRKQGPVATEHPRAPRRKSLFIELRLWKKLGRTMLPVLLLTFYLFLIESFFWTLAPLYAEVSGLGQLSGFFLAAYSLPALIVGWTVGSLTARFGKKRTAFAGLFAGSILLSCFSFFSNPYLLIVLVFASSFFTSVALPAINAAYADYISESSQVEGEIESLEDFAFNSAYVLGPVSAGLLTDLVGIPHAFSLLGFYGVITALVLLLITPKSITIRTRKAEL
jgi:MFS family permease